MIPGEEIDKVFRHVNKLIQNEDFPGIDLYIKEFEFNHIPASLALFMSTYLIRDKLSNREAKLEQFKQIVPQRVDATEASKILQHLC